MARPELSIVILSWNTCELTQACLRSLRLFPPQLSHEIILVDNGSQDGTVAMVRDEFPHVQAIALTENLLYSEGNNVGARAASGKWLCLLNSDTEVRAGCFDILVQFLESHPGYALASPRLVNPDGTTQRLCRRLPRLSTALADSSRVGKHWPFTRWSAHQAMADWDFASDRDVEQPPGACMIMARTEFLAGGGLATDLPLFFNDVELCLRLKRAGRKIRYLAAAKVMHHHGSSTGSNPVARALWITNRQTYYQKAFGLAGALWIRLVDRIWDLEVRAGIYLGKSTPEEKRSAFARHVELIRRVRELKRTRTAAR